MQNNAEEKLYEKKPTKNFNWIFITKIIYSINWGYSITKNIKKNCELLGALYVKLFSGTIHLSKK